MPRQSTQPRGPASSARLVRGAKLIGSDPATVSRWESDKQAIGHHTDLLLRAMADGDWGKAYFAAAQLVAMVDAVKVDRAFIQAKTARLSAQVKASKPDDATNQQLSGILSDVMQRYNDGNFAAANQRLNQLAGMLK